MLENAKRFLGIHREKKKPEIDWYTRGYTDGLCGRVGSIRYTECTQEDYAKYARGYADGLMEFTTDNEEDG